MSPRPIQDPISRLRSLLAEASMLSEAPAGNLGGIRGETERVGPGSWADISTRDEWVSMLGRLADAMEVDLQRIKGGDVIRLNRAKKSREDVNERVLSVWGGRSDRWVALVEDIPEEAVKALRMARRRERE